MWINWSTACLCGLLCGCELCSDTHQTHNGNLLLLSSFTGAKRKIDANVNEKTRLRSEFMIGRKYYCLFWNSHWCFQYVSLIMKYVIPIWGGGGRLRSSRFPFLKGCMWLVSWLIYEYVRIILECANGKWLPYQMWQQNSGFLSVDNSNTTAFA